MTHASWFLKMKDAETIVARAKERLIKKALPEGFDPKDCHLYVYPEGREVLEYKGKAILQFNLERTAETITFSSKVLVDDAT